jgi:hypothetical protein
VDEDPLTRVVVSHARGRRQTEGGATMLRILTQDRVADTLRVIADLPQPVSRSCHIGNNGNYNFAWLTLASNTRFVMYDHTTYGADRVCFPWMLVADYGMIHAAFDIDGELRHDLQGKHVGAPSAKVPGKYSSILNYGIRARVDGTPLFTYHFAANCAVAERYNNEEHTFDAKEILSNFELCSQIVYQFASLRELDKLFNRWVTQRKGRVLMQRIREICYRGDDLLVRGADGSVLFIGDLQALLESFRNSLRELVAHITHAAPLGTLSYPWFNLAFSYLFGAAAEYARHRQQTSFYHAGGLTSPYYMSSLDFGQWFGQLAARLQSEGFLPQADFSFNVVPIACCLLYASPSNIGSLEDLIECARAALRAASSPRDLAGAFQQSARDPCGATMLLDRVGPDIQAKLLDRILKFNRVSTNRLPVCLRISSIDHFTKYGLGGVHSRALREDAVVFPEALRDMTWGEAELIIQTLGSLLGDIPEDPGAST